MRRWLAAAIVASLAGAAGVARADAYDATLTRGIAAKERAMDVNEPARWEEALRLFQEADALRATREASYELGYAAERLARTDLAVEAYEAALDLGLTGQPRTKAEAFIGAHASALARLQLKGGAGNRVRAGGIDRGRLPLRRPLVLFPGDAVIEIVDPQNRATSHRITLAAAHMEILDLSSAVASSSPPPSSDTALLPLAPAPQPPPPLPAPPADQPAASAPASAWWLLGTGIALAATGGVMVAVSQSRVDEARADLHRSCDVITGDSCTNSKMDMQKQAQSAVDAIATWKAVRLGSWIGAGAGAVTAGVAVWMLVRGRPPESAPTVVVTDRGWTLGWMGRF